MLEGYHSRDSPTLPCSELHLPAGMKQRDPQSQKIPYKLSKDSNRKYNINELLIDEN